MGWKAPSILSSSSESSAIRSEVLRHDHCSQRKPDLPRPAVLLGLQRSPGVTNTWMLRCQRAWSGTPLLGVRLPPKPQSSAPSPPHSESPSTLCRLQLHPAVFRPRTPEKWGMGKRLVRTAEQKSLWSTLGPPSLALGKLEEPGQQHRGLV